MRLLLWKSCPPLQCLTSNSFLALSAALQPGSNLSSGVALGGAGGACSCVCYARKEGTSEETPADRRENVPTPGFLSPCPAFAGEKTIHIPGRGLCLEKMLCHWDTRVRERMAHNHSVSHPCPDTVAMGPDMQARPIQLSP